MWMWVNGSECEWMEGHNENKLYIVTCNFFSTRLYSAHKPAVVQVCFEFPDCQTYITRV